MPKRCDLKTICVLGSGPVVIGQAAEFDYSGTQAVKALKDDGYRVILINSNPASIMTNPDLADRSYVEPLTLDYVKAILKKEKPCALLPTVGGQTALNLALQLHEANVFEELGIELIGADISAIKKAEDREEFKRVMSEAGLRTLRSKICETFAEAQEALEIFGLPNVIRPSFTLGGTGGGIAHTKEQFFNIVENGFRQSPTHQLLIEESVIGHKEFEFEVIRDEADNACIVCSIENFDPMGVHTGDSITVAPAQTLSDVEYQILRDASLKVLRVIGVKTGGSNVQFSVDPKTGEFFVIEMNPRVSRSSALASKATGYPIAKVAAKLAVGYHLYEVINEITKKTTAAFEPALDYVVTKIPKFAFEKFSGQEAHLTTQMRSVGEVMAVGRSFAESLQKALASLEEGVSGLEASIIKGDLESGVSIEEYLKTPTSKRIWRIASALRRGYEVDQVAKITQIDPWFLTKMQQIVGVEQFLSQSRLDEISVGDFRHVKKLGYLDQRIAGLIGSDEKNVRARRKALGVSPVYKCIDTCSGEFEAKTPYLYSCYEDPFFHFENNKLVEKSSCEAKVSDRKKIIVLGSGPIRIGQGIEFDCCSTEAVMALRKLKFETIMINCNPETVSTDFDTADRLYFEPLTFEHVMNVIEIEKPFGVILQLGGQTPLSLANRLSEAGVNVLGTDAENIDRAEDRRRSTELFKKLGLRQPPSCSVTSLNEALEGAKKLGFPLMVRPSYVLGGRAMERVHSEEELKKYIGKAIEMSSAKPVLIDRFLDGAIEIDVDALSDGKNVFIAGILQHIEEAGIHSGDSACVLPPYDLSQSILDEIKSATTALCHELKIIGLLNIQFAVKDSALFVIEVNPRASRTVPFISKATNISLAQEAAKVISGESLKENLRNKDYTHVLPKNLIAMKAPVMPFSKFPKADPILGPEMRSTGEVMATANNFEESFIKSQLASGNSFKKKGNLFVSIADQDKEALLPSIKLMEELGFKIFATAGTHWFLSAHGVNSQRVKKVREGSPHVLDLLETGEIDVMFNTILGSVSVHDSHLFRKKALEKNISYFTSVSAAKALAKAISSLQKNDSVNVMSLQEIHQHHDWEIR